MTELEQLAALYPKPIKVTLASRKGGDGHPMVIEVSPIRVGRLAAFVRAVSGILPELERAETLDVVSLVINHTDHVIDTLVAAVGEDRELIEQLDLADVVDLMGAVVEANADFFIQRLTPAIEKAAGKIAALAGRKSASD